MGDSVDCFDFGNGNLSYNTTKRSAVSAFGKGASLYV